MRVLFNSCAYGQTRMRVLWELSDQVWMRVFFNSCAYGQTRMRVVRELSDQVWMRVFFNSRAYGQTRMRVKELWRVAQQTCWETLHYQISSTCSKLMRALESVSQTNYNLNASSTLIDPRVRSIPGFSVNCLMWLTREWHFSISSPLLFALETLRWRLVLTRMSS